MKPITQLAVARTKYAVNRAGQEEGNFQPLYDKQLYPAAGSAILTYFQTPIGGVRGAVALTEEDTNMEGAGQLPAGKSFLMTGIELFFASGQVAGRSAVVATSIANSIWSDISAIYKTGFLRFFINSKDYVKDGPIGVYPSSWRLAGVVALGGVGSAAGSADIVEHAQFAGRPYEVNPIFIPSLMNFRVTLEWPNGVQALPSANATSRLGIRLLGNLYRVSQ